MPGLPLDALPLDVVFHQLWRQLQDANRALAALHAALLDGRRGAWLDGQWLDPSYWKTATLRLDWVETSLCVVVVVDGREVAGRFHISEQPAATEPAPAESARTATRGAKRKWQRDPVTAALKKLYPPDGNVPDDISTAVVLGQITRELEPEFRKRGVSLPSRETVNRALGRS